MTFVKPSLKKRCMCDFGFGQIQILQMHAVEKTDHIWLEFSFFCPEIWRTLQQKLCSQVDLWKDIFATLLRNCCVKRLCELELYFTLQLYHSLLNLRLHTVLWFAKSLPALFLNKVLRRCGNKLLTIDTNVVNNLLTLFGLGFISGMYTETDYYILFRSV